MVHGLFEDGHELAGREDVQIGHDLMGKAHQIHLGMFSFTVCQFCGKRQYGTWNDKITIKRDDGICRLKTVKLYSETPWYCLKADGSMVEFRGVYFITDGGYL